MDLKKLQDMPPWEWPEGAENFILRSLRDVRNDESERLLAAELAGDMVVINDELALTLLTIAGSGAEKEELRGQAAISLGPVLEEADMDEFEDSEDMPISEQTFNTIRNTLRKLYTDADVPEEVRRRILEAAVRAPQEWHPDAIRAAYYSGNDSWQLTAVFCMRFVRGFDDQILEALRSKNEDIHYQAVCAAGNWEVDEAWSHVAALAVSEETEKELRLAAIESLAGLRPLEAMPILLDLTDEDDEDVVETAYEALAMAKGLADEDEEDDDEFC